MGNTKDVVAIREITFRQICNLAADHLSYLRTKDMVMDTLGETLGDVVGVQTACSEEREARRKFTEEFRAFVEQMRVNGRFRTIRVLWDEDN